MPVADAPEPYLTTRERLVIIFLASDLSRKQIASAMGIGIKTVNTHLLNISRKFHLHGGRINIKLTRYAIAFGLIPAPTKENW